MAIPWAIASLFSLQPIPPEETSQAARLCRLGNVFLEKFEFSVALERFEQSIDLEPANPNAWAGRGKALLKTKRYAAALVSLERSASLFQAAGVSEHTVLLDQALALQGLRHFQQAIICCEQFLLIAPQSLKAQWLQLQLLCRLKSYGDVCSPLMGYKHPLKQTPRRPPERMSSQLLEIRSW